MKGDITKIVCFADITCKACSYEYSVGLTKRELNKHTGTKCPKCNRFTVLKGGKVDKVEAEAVKLFTKNFGADIFKRFDKLKEEYKELTEAHNLFLSTDEKDNKDFEAIEHLIDELADVNAVVTHIASLFDLDKTTLLMIAIDKVKTRESNPNYKRDTNK